ncbi:acylneuraminate cytidylyltransferase family protein [Pelosinus propionicus]|uniref:N-acylneuraminate cytidylyltransferase n=1 Tax=Pelosinus propionicus DSM 13327 TaxID=1123291 RepID=A0A1I4HTP0_9FIRM|nr:acylneuraminate cytidylyltransferase family protein [Pelosinus propionicus]SFL45545.1 N-acylneuraminate cytidylyltransferase [Pelosinus propionicus DSM 13327]
MIHGKSVLAIIPARGGSKGIPGKNTIDVAGKPLIAWTIEAAKASKYIDRLILSSDDDQIINVAAQWGCESPFKRPDELSQDDTPGIAPVLHALSMVPIFDFIVLLQPTSPLRRTIDIDGCIERCITQQANCCVSVTQQDKSPFWMYYIAPDGLLEPVVPTHDQVAVRRQDLPVVYALNGAVYVACCEWLLATKSFLSKETIAYPMPKEYSVDIDSWMDLQLARLLLKVT